MTPLVPFAERQYINMKIKKSTIVWFVLAVLLAASQISGTEDSDEMTWADAVYVKDAKVLSENEGKFVAVSGNPRMLEPVVDENVGVTLQSPKVYRSVDVLKWDDISKEWKIKMLSMGSSDDGYETGTMAGRVALGDFELDRELITRLDVTLSDVERDDFSDEDIAHMEDTGFLVRSGGNFCYSDAAHQPLDSVSPAIEGLDKWDYIKHPEWDGGHKVSWDMWFLDSEDEITVVGIQKGNTLTYCKVNGGVSKDHIVSEDEVSDSADPNLVKVVAYALALLFVLLGVRSMFKKKNDC